MLVAILTDIHANKEAFQACLAHARLLKADRIALLGDLVGYGADPAFAVDTAMALAAAGAIVLKGNHDAAIDGSDENMNATARAAIAWTRGRLNDGQRAFLRTLPLTAEEGEVLYTHANGYSPGGWDYVLGPIGEWQSGAALQDARLRQGARAVGDRDRRSHRSSRASSLSK